MSYLKTLSHIELCLRIHWDPYAVDFHNPRQCAIAHNLEDSGLVELVLDGYRTTERGRVYVEAIRNLPLPVASWMMP